MSSKRRHKPRKSKAGRRETQRPGHTPPQPIVWNRRRVSGLLAVLALSLVLNCVGLTWGLSGLVPWQPDSIEGITTAREMPRLFKNWTYKYPRGHFLVNALFYQPLLKHWQKHPVTARAADGGTVSQVLTLERLRRLAFISRIISAVMGTATVAAVVLTAIWLFNDFIGALLAGLALAVSELFVFFSHVGNVDIPSVFWFTLGLYWAVKAVYVGKTRHFILMALCFSYGICTKDAMGGYLVGTAIAFWLIMVQKSRAAGETFKTASLSIFSKKMLLAAIVFVLLYALLQDILTCPRAFADRMSIWIGGRGVVDYNKDFKGQLPLLWEACRMLYGSLGWPLLTMIVLSLVYCAIKYPWRSALAIIPVVAFYVIVVVNIQMVQRRYFLPAFPGFALLAGKACSDWLKYKKIHIAFRACPIALAFALSLLYCTGVDLEMASDTRVRTEQWFYENVRPGSLVGAGIYNKVYAPRLHHNGYRLICPWQGPSNEGTAAASAAEPEYLIMTPDQPRTKGRAQDIFREKLAGGELDYELAASFKPKYLYPARTIFGFAAWPILTEPLKHPFISPEMWVFKKRPRDSRDQRPAGTTEARL